MSVSIGVATDPVEPNTPNKNSRFVMMSAAQARGGSMPYPDRPDPISRDERPWGCLCLAELRDANEKQSNTGAPPCCQPTPTPLRRDAGNLAASGIGVPLMDALATRLP